MNEIKPIKRFDDYFVDTDGNIYSMKSGKLIKLKPYIDTKGKYLMIRLIRNDGVRKSLLLHRIVAEAFIPNPNNLPEVNHKDKDTKNPKAENLEWCTRKYNLKYSHITDSPIKNYNPCKLYKGDNVVGNFKSILDAVRYAGKYYGAKEKQLERNLQTRDIKIIPEKQGRKNKASLEV